MTHSPRPHDVALRPPLDEVNAAIRRLMTTEPPSTARSAEYARLLRLWAEATGAGLAEWVRAA